MRKFADRDAVVAAAPCDLGTAGWVTVDQEDVNRFADATRAHEWIHVDADRAQREGPFGTTVAHGFLTLSLATHFQTELLEVGGPVVGGNYGVDSARFPDALPVGSRVRASGRLKSATRAADGTVRIVVGLTYEREGGGKPPCVADIVSLLVPTEG